jgi:hypothetical protein
MQGEKSTCLPRQTAAFLPRTATLILPRTVYVITQAKHTINKKQQQKEEK